VFDMATSVVGLGRLLQRGKAGLPIPAGWATDAEGTPSTDPAKAVIPLPMAGHKGSGLSLMIEMLTGLLGGNPLIAAALLESHSRHSQNALILAIDIAKFVDAQTFRREAGRLLQAIKSLKPAEENVEVRMPGERGDRMYEERSRAGIPLPDPLYQDLKRIGERAGVAPPAP
jgi:ureidoglycolate dehydrogenase (NAD+)